MTSSGFIIAAHDVCDSCNGPSGPKFSLRPLRGPSEAHRTNETLKGAELQSCLDDIRDTQLEIDKFDTEIARVKENLKGLKRRRAELVKYKNQEMSLFSPIRSLPDDVLKHIFLLCHGMEENPGYIDFGIVEDTFVQAVTSVSNYWRNTALSMPVLWSRISFAYLDGMESKMKVSPGEFVQRCLTLSGSAPFSIEFGKNCDLKKILGESCLEKLAEAAHRWEHITVDQTYTAELSGWTWAMKDRIKSKRTLPFDTIMKYIPMDTVFSNLKTIGPIKSSTPITFYSTPVLESAWVMCGDPGTGTSIYFQSAPSLRYADATASGCYGSPNDFLPHFPWHQISKFQCDAGFTSNQLSTLLNSMPSLEEFDFTLNSAIELPTSTVIMLPLLKKLSFLVRKGDYAGPLNFFTVPALKELVVDGDCNSDVILGLIRRSRCNIEQLTLPGNSLFGEWDIDEMKMLKYLNIYWSWTSFGGAMNDLIAVINLLTWTCEPSTARHQVNVFPQLEALEFYFPEMFLNDKPFPIEEFKAMVTSRLPPTTPPRIHAGMTSLNLLFQNIWQDLDTTELITQYFDTLRESRCGIRAVIKYENKGLEYSTNSDTDTDSSSDMDLNASGADQESDESDSD